MWQLFGCGIGAALGMGFAAGKGQHWAVRVLCFVLAAGAVVAGLAFALIGGKDSPLWGALNGGMLAFVLVSVAYGLAWILERVTGSKVCTNRKNETDS